MHQASGPNNRGGMHHRFATTQFNTMIAGAPTIGSANVTMTADGPN